MSDQGTFLMDLFPDLIISEILTRLPAKSVCRFKSVSKRWNSIICNYRFILSYISRVSPSSSWVILNRIPQLADESTQHSTQLTLVDRPKVSTFSVNLHKLADDPVTDPTRSNYPTVILHSSNGLFLLTVHINRDPHKEHAKDPNYFSLQLQEEALFVGNPITREWVPLPKPRRPIHKRTHVAFTTRVDPGTGVVDKFLVVEYQPLIGSGRARLVCFSSDIGKWVEKPANYMLGGHFWRAEGSFEFDGQLFFVDLSTGLITWDAVDKDPFADLESDVAAAACRFIPLPNGRGKPFNTLGLEDERCIGTGGGVIQYLEVFKKGKLVLKVWRLDVESGEWSFTYKISRSNVEKYLVGKAENTMPKPCFVHPYEADVAYFETGDYIFSLNVKSKQMVRCDSFQGHEFVIPYVIPRWPTPLPPRLYAAFAKEQGSEHFKSQEFEEAIKYYSKSIDLSPSAVAYANRAMAYLKVQSYLEAENDCSEVLKLDDKYFKVYARRAQARKELGNLEGSMHDVAFALKLEPGNQQMMDEYAELKSLLDKACVAENVESHGVAAGDTQVGQ